MKSFKKYIIEKEIIPTDKVDTKEPEKSSSEENISSTGEWTKTHNGWVVSFKVGSSSFMASFFPIDDNELHWKFTYFIKGNRDSSDIKKFGLVDQWEPIWETLVEILKDFIKIFKPKTIKFIGMSISKRSANYKELFNLYIKKFRNSFRHNGYFSTFDSADINQAPSFVIKKGDIKYKSQTPDNKLKETLDLSYKLISQRSDRNIYKGEWKQPEKDRKEGDDGKYIAIKVEFIHPSTKQYAGSTLESRFKTEQDGLEWARTVKQPAVIPDDFSKNYGNPNE